MENKGYRADLASNPSTMAGPCNSGCPPGYVDPESQKTKPVVIVQNPSSGGRYVPLPSMAAEQSSSVGHPNFGSSFSDKNIRRLFIRKVYLILFAQMVVTFAVVAIFVFEPHVNLFVRKNIAIYFAAYVIFLVMYFILICCPSVRRKHPGNIICLFIFTLALSYLTGTISSFHDTRLVLYAAGICTGVTLMVSLLAMWSKFDITGWGGMLWMFCLTLFFFGFVAIFTYSQIMYTIYSALAALLLMMLLAYHTQLIIGGRRHELSAEEHVAAAMVLYLDIVNLFTIIIGIGGRMK